MRSDLDRAADFFIGALVGCGLGTAFFAVLARLLGIL